MLAYAQHAIAPGERGPGVRHDAHAKARRAHLLHDLHRVVVHLELLFVHRLVREAVREGFVGPDREALEEQPVEGLELLLLFLERLQLVLLVEVGERRVVRL